MTITLDNAVVCAVMASRIAIQSKCEDEELSLNAMLADLVIDNDRDTISESLLRVEQKGAEVLLEELIDQYKLSNFIAELQLEPFDLVTHDGLGM